MLRYTALTRGACLVLLVVIAGILLDVGGLDFLVLTEPLLALGYFAFLGRGGAGSLLVLSKGLLSIPN